MINQIPLVTAQANPKLAKAAEQLEASFWAEMLKSSNAFDYGGEGGIGSDQFKSFMIEQQSQLLARTPIGNRGAYYTDTRRPECAT